MISHPFKGAGVALITPFKTNKSIDFNALENIVDDQIKNGMDYLVALGTTAETPTLSSEEQQEVIKCIVGKANNRVPVVVGIGGNDPAKVIRSINSFDLTGVKAILSVTPYYNKPSQEGLYHYYQEIINVSPLPLILYNVPSRTGANLDSTTTLRIAESSKKVIAVKEASGDTVQIALTAFRAPDHFKVISGDDVLALPSIAVGAIGVISVVANALPEKVSQMVHYANEQKIWEAQKIHHELLDLLKAIFSEGNPSGLKALMQIMGKATNELRLPLYPVSKETLHSIEQAYKRISQ